MSDRLSDWAWPVLDVIVSTAQVLTDELDELKRRRAQMRADGRELARQEKNMKKRRTRLMQACLSSAEPEFGRFLFLRTRQRAN